MRTAILIDGPNLYHMAKSLSVDIDYMALVVNMPGNADLLRPYYFTITADDGEFESIVPLIDFLEYNGFTVKTKVGKPYVDATTGSRRVRGYLGGEIAITALTIADQVEQIVFISGDGDLVSLVETLARKGKRIVVAASLATCSDELRRAADRFIDLSSKAMLAAITRKAKDAVAA